MTELSRWRCKGSTGVEHSRAQSGRLGGIIWSLADSPQALASQALASQAWVDVP